MSLELMALILECDMIQTRLMIETISIRFESDASKQLPNF
jgi:hypothetical protein